MPRMNILRTRVLAAAILLSAVASLNGAELRLGIVGTDTSHAVAFTAILNDASVPGPPDRCARRRGLQRRQPRPAG